MSLTRLLFAGAGLLTILGVIWRLRSIGLVRHRAIAIGLAVLIGGIVGAALASKLYGAEFFLSPSILSIVGIIVAVALAARAIGQSSTALVDAILPIAFLGLGVAQAVSLNWGSIVGRYTQAIFAQRLPKGSAAWEVHASSGLISENANWSLPIHPLPIYLATLDLALAGILCFGRLSRGQRAASRWCWYLAAQATGATLIGLLQDPSPISPQPYFVETNMLIALIAATAAAGLQWLTGKGSVGVETRPPAKTRLAD